MAVGSSEWPSDELIAHLLQGHCLSVSVLNQGTSTPCPGAGPPTSLMSNWDSEGMGKWQQCHHCSLAPEPQRARATRRLGRAGLGWKLQLLDRPPAASVISAGRRGDRSCCPGDATSTESPEAQDKQTCLVCNGQRFLSAEGLGIHAQWRVFGFIRVFIHSFLIPSIFIQPLRVSYLKHEKGQLPHHV